MFSCAYALGVVDVKGNRSEMFEVEFFLARCALHTDTSYNLHTKVKFKSCLFFWSYIGEEVAGKGAGACRREGSVIL